LSIIVSDTSPIRALAHLGNLDLLHALFGEVLIPPALVVELQRPRSKLPALSVRELPFVRIEAPRDRTAVDELLSILGPGEAEALVLAVELHADAILIDEAAGRAVARQKGLLPELTPLLDRLQRELGFFISAEVRAEILKQAGE
jgi:predicted nucleic acid-binding protein